MCDRRKKPGFGGRIQLYHLYDFGKSLKYISSPFLVKKELEGLAILEECCKGPERGAEEVAICEGMLAVQA